MDRWSGGASKSSCVLSGDWQSEIDSNPDRYGQTCWGGFSNNFWRSVGNFPLIPAKTTGVRFADNGYAKSCNAHARWYSTEGVAKYPLGCWMNLCANGWSRNFDANNFWACWTSLPRYAKRGCALRRCLFGMDWGPCYTSCSSDSGSSGCCYRKGISSYCDKGEEWNTRGSLNHAYTIR